MKIIATEKAYFKGSIIRAGEILTIANNAKIPAWAKKIGDEKVANTPVVETPEPKEPQQDTEQKQLEIQTDADVKKDTPAEQPADETPKQEETEPAKPSTAVEQPADDGLENMSEEEIAKTLDDLITKLVENGLMIQEPEKKTVIEQIREARKLLEQKQ